MTISLYLLDKDRSDGSTERFKEIAEAYRVLSDENERRKYDLTLKYGTAWGF